MNSAFSRQHAALIAVGDEQTGAALAAEFEALGWSVIGPYTSTARAMRCLTASDEGAADRMSDRTGPDLAILDALMTDGSALRLTLALRRRGVRVAFFAAYDANRRRIRAEFPDAPGLSREATVPDLVEALGGAVAEKAGPGGPAFSSLASGSA